MTQSVTKAFVALLLFTLSLFIYPVVSQAQVLEQDSLALVAFYKSTNGDNWVNNENWLTGQVITWYGISLSNNRVVSIDLRDNNLKGILPMEIGQLTMLKELWLPVNSLMGLIPVEIGNLKNLQTLRLDWNHNLSGEIPIEIFKLTNLVDLDLSLNNLTGEISFELGNLTNLTHLNLSNNKITGSIPDIIGNLIYLWNIDLSDNQLSGVIPKELGNLTNLQVLDLQNLLLSGDIPTEIGNLRKLSFLGLSNNKFTGEVPLELGNLVELTYLGLSNNQLSGVIPIEIMNLQKLGSVEFNDNEINDIPQNAVFASTNLYTLNFSSNELTFEDLEGQMEYTSISYKYIPQSKIGQPETISLNSGDSYTLNVTCGGTANSYQWYYNNQPIGSLSSNSSYTISNLSTANSGKYHCQIANSIVPDLFIESEPISLKIISSCIVEKDSLALLELYNSTNGANWTNNLNWLSGPLNTWYGITVENCNITEIKLSNNNLSGTLPPILGSLNKVELLYLDHNNISGEIPPELGNITNLVELYLNNNQLTGSVPDELGALDFFTRIYLQYNHLSSFSGYKVIGLPKMVDYSVTMNNFTFEDFEPAFPNNLKVPDWYFPQLKVGKKDTIPLYYGDDYTLDITCGGDKNVYQWYFKGLPFGVASNSSFLNLINLSDANAGEYYCIISNTIVPDLIIESEPIILDIKPKNNTPSELILSNNTIEENQATGTLIGIFSTIDVDSDDTFTYSFVSGTGDVDNGSFIINDDQLLSNSVFNFEIKSTYRIRVQTKDQAGLSYAKQFIISITDLDENQAPSDLFLSKNSIKENQPIGTNVGILGTDDPDAGDTFTYSLISGTGDTNNKSFSITNNYLATNEVFDYELKSIYTVLIQTTDNSGASFSMPFTISIIDVNEAPTKLALSNNTIEENQAEGTFIGFLSTEDPDQNEIHQYSLVAGQGDDDNINFQITDNNLLSNVVFDYEIKNSFSIRIQSKDKGGETISEAFVIQVTDIFEPIEELLVPTAFSPNNDGFNDTFEIKGLKQYPNAKLEVFNRYGKLVFSRENYGNPDFYDETERWWNGYLYANGQFGSAPLPEGVYFISLQLNANESIKQSLFLKNQPQYGIQ